MTRRPSSGYGIGRRKNPLNTLNTVALAPMASASTSTVTTA
jgi:hypothetical protein